MVVCGCMLGDDVNGDVGGGERGRVRCDCARGEMFRAGGGLDAGQNDGQYGRHSKITASAFLSAIGR